MGFKLSLPALCPVFICHCRPMKYVCVYMLQMARATCVFCVFAVANNVLSYDAGVPQGDTFPPMLLLVSITNIVKPVCDVTRPGWPLIDKLGSPAVIIHRLMPAILLLLITQREADSHVAAVLHFERLLFRLGRVIS